MKSGLLPVLLLVCFSTFSQEKKKADDLYKEGLKAESEKTSGLPYFLAAAQLAEEGTDLKLKSIYKSIYNYNYGNAQEKSVMNALTSYAVKNLLKSKRSDTLSADLYLKAGQIYRAVYQPDTALMCFHSALKRFNLLLGKESVQAAYCYRGIGEIYESFFYDYNKAEALYEHALAIHEKSPPGKFTDFMIGIMYAHLVEVNRKQKDLDKTLFYSVRNISLAESMIADYPAYTENAYEGLAITYGDLEQPDKARQFYRKAIDQNQLVNHRANNPLLGNYYEGMGELDERQGLVDNAIRNYEKADQIFRSLNDSKSPKYIKTLQRLSVLYASKDENKSLRFLKSALQKIEFHSLTKSGQATELNTSVGDYFTNKNQVDSAVFYYQKALQSCSKKFASFHFNDNPSNEDITLKDYAFKVIVKKAHLLSDQYSITQKSDYAEAAVQSYSIAQELLSQSRADLDTDRSKWDFFDSNFQLYEHAIALLFKMNQVKPSDSLRNQAFKYMESSKSKTLSDALNQAEVADGLIGIDSLVQSLNAEKRKLHLFEDQLKKRNASNQGSKSDAENINNSMIAADRSIQRIEQKLNEKYPSYLKTKYQNKIPLLREMQAYALRKHATLIEYFWGTENIYAIAIDGKKIRLKKTGRVDSVEQVVRTMLAYLKEESNDYSKESIAGFAFNSSELYKILLSPFHEQLESNDHLIIIPDGLLGQLPFEVLTVSETKQPKADYQSLNYLVKTHFVSYSFSSAYLLSEKSSGSSRSQLVAFGFTGNEPTRSRPGDHNFQEIVGSEEEIKDLAEKFPDGEFFLGKDVTETRFKEKAPLFDIIHLAVHGEGDTEQNYSASLYFRDSLTSGKEDGRLNWYELFDIRLKAQLAVISSCESGIGKAYRGEGMLSMANAFAYAGCRNVVMGLWKVNDKVSVSLMKSFYENIKNGKDVDDALTYAKREYIQSGDEFSSNPKIWASLVAYGNNQVIKNEMSFNLIYSILLSIIFLFIIFLVIRIRQTKRVASRSPGFL